MLLSLSIRDVVLIEALDLELGAGLGVLTGETGAGKSILLDALGLALGARGERGLVRHGAAQATVTAVFRLPPGHAAHALLEEAALPAEDELVLRRALGADGRSRAFVNEQPVGTTLLRRLGERLVEVHGQHEQVGLLDTSSHRALLDAYGRLLPMASRLRAAHGRWRAALVRQEEAEARLAREREEEAYLRHRLEELEALAPRADEEEELAERRARLQNRERLAEVIREALAGAGSARERLGGAQRRVERSQAMASGLLEPAATALERALVELAEAVDALESAGREVAEEGGRLEEFEERLFALRAAARKHRVAVAELPALAEATARALAGLEEGGLQLRELAQAAARAQRDFAAEARALSAARAEAAQALARAVSAELPPLRLERVRFEVALLPLPEGSWGAEGAERVAFEVATNPGQPLGPLGRVASGGELARLMLALKVVLARTGSVPTVIFDEIDSGIGGAVADAVGERLARLGRDLQVLVVTHAPQVAARADRHLRVHKRQEGGRALVEAQALDAPLRREEIARMLAGARITEAARAAAASLIGQAS